MGKRWWCHTEQQGAQAARATRQKTIADDNPFVHFDALKSYFDLPYPRASLGDQCRLVGSGTGGAVFVLPASQYAMKIANTVTLPPSGVDGQLLCSRFAHNEEHALRALRSKPHANVVRIFYVDPRGSYCLMENCSLGDVAGFMTLNSDAAADPELADAWGVDLLDGYIHMHDVAGFVHGDIKPENVLVRRGDQLHLCYTDFSSSKCTNARCQFKGDGFDIGPTGTTFWYLAPEQLEEEARHADARVECGGEATPVFMHTLSGSCDAWAIGMVAYFIMNGRHLFDGVDCKWALRVAHNRLLGPDKTDGGECGLWPPVKVPTPTRAPPSPASGMSETLLCQMYRRLVTRSLCRVDTLRQLRNAS